MTIKEMQKVYKKINKAENNALNAMCTISKIFREISNIIREGTCNYASVSEAAKIIVKSQRIIEKISNAMGVSDGDITGFINEDDFVKWCILNNIEMHENESASNDEETDSDE